MTIAPATPDAISTPNSSAQPEIEDRLHEAHDDHAGEMAGEQGAAAHRGQGRQLRKPFWMSRARSVPAFIVANKAPWMNGTATAKARNESVGKPSSAVDGFRPPR